VEAVDKLRDTMQSHERCSVVEVMGHESGNLATYVGISTGATAILVPEIPCDINDLFEKMRVARIRGRHHHIIIIAEGVGHASELAESIRRETGIETRGTVLGHVQRGGSPSARDRVTATRMGCCAVDTLLAGRTNRVICYRDSDIVDMDIDEALSLPRSYHEDMYKTASRLAY
jgi:6-phosphofructokinase 1